MVSCSVSGCKSNSARKEADVTFHGFPAEDEVYKKWIAGTGKKNWVPHKHSRICSKHFERHCFRKTTKLTFIHKSSIPTLTIHNVTDPEVDAKDCSHQLDSGIIELTDGSARKPQFKREEIDPEDGTATDVDCQDPLNVSWNFPVKHEFKVEPTEFVDCPTQTDTHAQQDIVTAKSIECATSSDKSVQCTEEVIISLSPTRLKLTLQLNRQTLLAESRRKKLEASRSKIRRLQKKNAELTAIIEDLKKNRFINQESADLLPTVTTETFEFEIE